LGCAAKALPNTLLEHGFERGWLRKRFAVRLSIRNERCQHFGALAGGIGDWFSFPFMSIPGSSLLYYNLSFLSEI